VKLPALHTEHPFEESDVVAKSQTQEKKEALRRIKKWKTSLTGQQEEKGILSS